VQITYALANVYDDSPDLDVRVSDEHRGRAEEMMACVESGDVTRLREMFLEVREEMGVGGWRGAAGEQSAACVEAGDSQLGPCSRELPAVQLSCQDPR
jgi:restriction endonuclease Mrr